MKRVVFLSAAVLAFLWNEGYSQPQIDLWCEYDAGGAIVESFKDIYRYSEGGYLVCGESYTSGWAVKLNEEGEIDWETFVDSSIFASVIEADNGDAVIGGGGKPYNTNFRAVRIDRNGDIVWRRDYAVGHCSAVIEMKNDDFLIAGWSGFAGYVVRIEGDGDVVWANRYLLGGENEYHRLYAMRETEDGVIIVGDYRPAGRSRIGWIIKVGFGGNVIWSRRYDAEGGGRQFRAIVSIPAGGFAVGGDYWRNWVWGTSESKFCLTKIDAEGNIREEYIYHLAQGRGDMLNGINKLSDGFILVGYTAIGNYTYPLALRTNRSFDPVWSLNYADIVEDRPPGGQPNTPTMLACTIVDEHGSIIACGGFMSERDERGQDGLVVRLEPQMLGPQVFYYQPEDTVLSVLHNEEIDFIVRARTREGIELHHQWLYGERELGNDTLQSITFDSLGVIGITCRLSDVDAAIELHWRVTVTDLYVSHYSPDSLNLTLRRGQTVDFSLDTVRAVEGDPVFCQWRKSNDFGEVEDAGTESRATVDFLQSGHYSIEGLAYRGESSDAVTWSVDVRGVVWSFAPEDLSLEVLPDSLIRFEVIPTNPEDTTLSSRWFVDDDLVLADTLSLDWLFSYPVHSVHSVLCVLSDSVESDTVSWTVTVRDLGMQSPAADPPRSAALLSVSPNPFNSTLTIRFSDPINRKAPKLAIYDISGREVARLVYLSTAVTAPSVTERREKAVKHGGMTAERTITWNASDVPAGIYFVRLQSGGSIVTRKVALIR